MSKQKLAIPIWFEKYLRRNKDVKNAKILFDFDIILLNSMFEM